MSFFNLPPNLGEILGHQLGLRAGETPRISFVCGPGDVVGTFEYWRTGRQDPRQPVVAYSWMYYDLIRHLGAETQVLTSHPPPADPDSVFQFVQVHRLPSTGRLGYFHSEARYARDVAAQVDRFQPHVVLAHTDFPPSGWARLGRGRKLVLSAHNTFWPVDRTPAGLKGRLQLQLLRSWGRSLNAAVCVSPACQRQIRAITNGRVEATLAYPQLVSSFPVQARERARNLLFLGRIEQNKGIFLLLDTFVALKRRHPDLTLTFAGAGTSDTELRSRIAAAGVPDIRFAGELESDDVHREIATSDLVVCPTMSGFNEGLAKVGLEAAAHGIPSVLSSVVPAAELLGDGCATFRADDGEGLQRVLEALVTDAGAYTTLRENLTHLAPGFHDRTRSWGAQLGQALLRL